MYSEECTVYYEQECEPHPGEVLYPAGPHVSTQHLQNIPNLYDLNPPRTKRDYPGYPPYAPKITAPPSCKPVPKEICHKIPQVVPRKVSHEVCHPVPTSHCGYVLEMEPEVKCAPHPVETCKDEAREAPYIVEQQECEQVVYDECQEVTKKYYHTSIPIICRLRQGFLLKYAEENDLENPVSFSPAGT